VRTQAQRECSRRKMVALNKRPRTMAQREASANNIRKAVLSTEERKRRGALGGMALARIPGRMAEMGRRSWIARKKRS
jgi:hypothetical protein